MYALILCYQLPELRFLSGFIAECRIIRSDLKKLWNVVGLRTLPSEGATSKFIVDLVYYFQQRNGSTHPFVFETTPPERVELMKMKIEKKSFNL